MENRSDIALIALRQILKATVINARALAREAGLTPSQHIILQLVDTLNKPTPGVVAKEASITQATVTSLIDKLEKRSLVARRKDDVDKRRVIVDITAEGTKALREAPDVLQDQFQGRFAKLQDWEQSMIITVLERVASILDAEYIDAAPILDVGAINKSLPPE
jgi:DNA-binding MarR family transcriptional regulator